MKRETRQQTEQPKRIRCAIYTRKSTDEGLDMDFNSLDAQRESAEAYITSMKNEGWLCLPDFYDDGGFSGGNMERPALKRLMADAEAGKIDCLVVYKVDRLSRSLLDFTRIMETLEKHNVSFVSVTQQFNTTHSMGRLTLNILLSFAQFEREIIAERTRDKMAAARRKGKWTGGMPVLGYDVDSRGGRLVINAFEAARIREIYDIYLDRQSLLATVAELNRRGWTTKKWTTKRGLSRGGKPFNKNNLSSLLNNVLYMGKVSYKGEEFEGEHEAIVDEAVWRATKEMLRRNGRNGGSDNRPTHLRNKYGALLKGLMDCACCNARMVNTSVKRGDKVYRYYVCTSAQKKGWDSCPTKSIPALEIEDFIVDRIRGIGRDKRLTAKTLSQAQEQLQERMVKLTEERRGLETDLRRLSLEERQLLKETARDGSGESSSISHLAEIQEKMTRVQERVIEIDRDLTRLQIESIDKEELTAALAHFDPVWDSLRAHEKVRLIRLLIQGISYNGEKETVSINFRPSGIKELAKAREA